MSRTWADGLDNPGVAAAVRAGRMEGGRRGAARRDVRRRRVVALFVLVVVVGVVIAATFIARDDDAYSGLWWEPDTGRRIEIVREGDRYSLLYGAARRPFAAEKRGDELVIAAPLGGDIVVRAVAADRLLVIDGGQTTTLQPAPDGS